MGGRGKEIAKDAMEAADTQLADFKQQAATAQIAVDAQKKAYKDIEFKNPYAGMKNQFEGMENVMEDVTVNLQQAQFQAQQGAQQRANIMNVMRGAAGGSGIAALAQSMANQGQLAAQKSGAMIGDQEAANQAKTAAEASRLDTLERQGEQTAQQREMDKQGTLLGMSRSEEHTSELQSPCNLVCRLLLVKKK